MTLPNEQEPARTGQTGEARAEDDPASAARVHDERTGVQEDIEAALFHKKMALQELSRRREAGEISLYDCDLIFIFRLNEMNAPLTRRDLEHKTGKQAVVLTPEDFDKLGYLDFINCFGELTSVEAESLHEDDVFILYPDDLGDEEGKPCLEIVG